MKIKIQKISPDIKIPQYARRGDAGLDLYSNEEYILKPGERKDIGTGIKMEIPESYAGLIWDKSGRALKYGLKTMGGVVDSNYRGEIKVIILNVNKNKAIRIRKNTKIAQMLIQKIEGAELEIADRLNNTARGEGGFGSTDGDTYSVSGQ